MTTWALSAWQPGRCQHDNLCAVSMTNWVLSAWQPGSCQHNKLGASKKQVNIWAWYWDDYYYYYLYLLCWVFKIIYLNESMCLGYIILLLFNSCSSWHIYCCFSWWMFCAFTLVLFTLRSMCAVPNRAVYYYYYYYYYYFVWFIQLTPPPMLRFIKVENVPRPVTHISLLLDHPTCPWWDTLGNLRAQTENCDRELVGIQNVVESDKT